MRVVGIIPARGGSRRLPGKNTRPLLGRPLLAYTCEAALGSGVLTDVFINTDSPEIAACAAECGVACPALRPAALAADTTPTRDAVVWLLDLLVARGLTYDALMILQPTSPLRTCADISAALDLYEDHAPCAVVSVTAVAPSNWLGHVRRDGQLERMVGDAPVFRLNGAIYVYSCDDYRQERTPRKTVAYGMPAERGVDIDTREDWALAEALLSAATPVGVNA